MRHSAYKGINEQDDLEAMYMDHWDSHTWLPSTARVRCIKYTIEVGTDVNAYDEVRLEADLVTNSPTTVE